MAGPQPYGYPTGGIDNSARTLATSAQAAANAAVSATAAYSGAIGKLKAHLAARPLIQTRVFFAGSSTVAGQMATTQAAQFTQLVSMAMQGAYPSGTGSEQPMQYSAAGTFNFSSTPGVAPFNVGMPGADYTTYMPDALIAAISAANPAVVFHMIGSNDYYENLSPASYQAGLQAIIAKFKAQTTGPTVHVLLNAFQRPNATNPTYPWAQYGAAMQAIAAADPTNVAYLDLNAPYVLSGVPGSDPLTLMYSDGIHGRDNSHALLADQILAAIGVRFPTPQPVFGAGLFTATAPSISGGTAVGSVLTATNGTWNNTPDSYYYQWQRAGMNIAGATASTYTTVTADNGQAITCLVTAGKSGFRYGNSVTNSITVTASGSTTLTNTTAPAVTPTTGSTGTVLTTTNGTWSATPDSYTYQWYRNGAAISGATSSTYTVVTDDLGMPVLCVVNVAKSGYTSNYASSNTVTPSSSGGGLLPILTSDTFSVNEASLTGSPTDAGLGGTPKTYTASVAGNILAAAGGVMVAGSAPAIALIAMTQTTSPDQHLTVTVNNPGTGTFPMLGVVVRRQAISVSAAYRIQFMGSGVIACQWVNSGGTQTSIAGLDGVVTYVAGDAIGLSAIGSTISIWKNGSIAASVTDTNVPGSGTNYAGFSVHQTSLPNLSIDNAILRSNG